MSKKPAVAIPVVKPMAIELSPDPRGDAMITFDTPGDTNVVLVLPMAALFALEAMLGKPALSRRSINPFNDVFLVKPTAETCHDLQHIRSHCSKGAVRRCCSRSRLL